LFHHQQKREIQREREKERERERERERALSEKIKAENITLRIA